MSPSLDRPRTGKSISVAFALRACVRACERSCVSAMTISVARADPMRFPGDPAGVRPASGRSPVQLFRIGNAH